MRWISLFLLCLVQVAWADPKLESVSDEKVPLALLEFVPAKVQRGDWRVFRLTGLPEGQRYIVVFPKGNDHRFVIYNPAYRRLNAGSGGAALLYGPEIDARAEWLGKPSEPGLVLYGGGGLDLNVLVFPRGLSGPSYFEHFDEANSASSIGGLSVGPGRDRRGRFCVEEYTVGPPDSGPSQVLARWVWTGKGFARRE